MDSFSKKDRNKKRIVVVGTGISGLMDALALHLAGFQVEIHSKSPDPRKNKKIDFSSSTHNGELGRFISRFEGEHYLGSSPMYPNMKKAFQTHVSQGGWLGKKSSELDAFDKAWLKKRAAANKDKKQQHATENFYVYANGQAMILWRELIKNFPVLFHQADLLNTGITRLYDKSKLFKWAVLRHKKEGVLEKALTKKDIINKYQYFSEAVELGHIAGAVEAPGFSFNIHRFSQNLISYLESQGVTFIWENCVYRVKFNAKKIVEGLVSEMGIIKANGYSLNPGAYAEETLFKGTPGQNEIAGVAGRWMLMPAPKNFKRPVKIHGDVRTEKGKHFPVVDVNLTHFTKTDGSQWLAVGGGYAYLGKPPFKSEVLAFDVIDQENERTVSRILGPTYRQAKLEGKIIKSTATCVRSFTSNDIPIMNNMQAENHGILRINAGTNTGTTTISPFTAQETVRAFTKNL